MNDRLKRPRFLVGAAASAAALFTVAASIVPAVDPPYRSPVTHVAIETAATLIAAIVAVIFIGRFQRRRARTDLMLAGALLLLALTNLLFSTVPALAEVRPGPFEIWAPLVGRTVAAAMLVAAAFLPESRVLRPRRALAQMAGAVFGALAAIAAVLLLLEPVLPRGIDPQLSPAAGDRVVGPAALLVSYVVMAALYGAAAIGFTRRAERSADELLVWLAAGTAVAAFSRLNYFLFPSIYSEWVYTGDVLRLAFYLLLLAGAVRAIAAYQRGLASAAVYEERRRLARDLHDGIAQDLAFIASHSQRLDGGDRPEVAALIRQAAERALDESRTAIGVLTRPADESLCAAIERTVRDLAGRSGVGVSLRLEREADAEPEVQEALLRIVGEAVNNSVRHGGARTVTVSVEQDPGLRVAVSDNGAGFHPEARSGGFGLTSMRERAAAIGAELAVESAPGSGTRVEVRLP